MSAESTNVSDGTLPADDNVPTPKAVTITEEPEHIPNDSSYFPSPHPSPKMHRASISGKKMTGRPAPLSHNPSSPSLSRTISHLKLEDLPPPEPISPGESFTGREETKRLLSQVQNWLQEEKVKKGSALNGYNRSALSIAENEPAKPIATLESGVDLEKLESILSSFAATMTLTSISEQRPKKSHSTSSFRRGSIAKAFKRSSIAPPASSDTEWTGEDAHVPHVEASLDNSRTLAFTGGSTEIGDIEAAQERDMKYWSQFKQDIVRLTHTLKLRGWRKIPIEKGDMILVERLSGALTNAVYVVKPPEELPEPDDRDSTKAYQSRSKPKELLLRIYGPQVEHLIDRDTELDILGRLARKKIGPRLLGYFTNGRFEEYLHAKTLEAEDLRVPATSKQIAKRMRELHEGIDLLPSERAGGARVFASWDKWVDRCEKVTTWLDLQVKREAEGHAPPSKRYTRRGLVCGVEWPVFKKAYDDYRKMLVKECGGVKAIQNRLVFAHNDAQYGNLMRLDPPGDSPLLHAANQHRQLVVIDFEYAGANAAGYEFANHFTEWCYNYHEAATSYACNTKNYPTPEEQRMFVRAYVMHRPQYASQASSTPKMEGREKTNISSFMLDARNPQGGPAMDYDKEEKAREDKVERDIDLLLRETRLWRIANAAFWTSWGIVQAKVPELDDVPKKSKAARVAAALDKVRERIHPHSDPLDEDVKAHQKASKHDRPEGREKEEAHVEGDTSDEGEEEIEEFDYLAYAQERAMLFWGDCLQMGVVKEQDLPESLLKQIKVLQH